MYFFGEGDELAVLPSCLEKSLIQDKKALLYDDLIFMDQAKMDRNMTRLKSGWVKIRWGLFCH